MARTAAVTSPPSKAESSFAPLSPPEGTVPENGENSGAPSFFLAKEASSAADTMTLSVSGEYLNFTRSPFPPLTKRRFLSII